ncbi:uncharacterized protein [Triticum aestivum]|uniref:uncharacterized protein n=1 Tax=Triticum aestivum TaxID=4565 RepID=UPI001D025374|nr:uncharacterized protein LOC123065708 [Triticum aestivum]
MRSFPRFNLTTGALSGEAHNHPTPPSTGVDLAVVLVLAGDHHHYQPMRGATPNASRPSPPPETLAIATESEEGDYTESFEEPLADYFGQDLEEDELAEEDCASEPNA